MWRTYYDISSQQYLINSIHNKITKQYLSQEAKNEADKEQAYAKELQFYLQELKNYGDNLKNKKNENFLLGQEWNLFLDTLRDIRTNDPVTKLYSLFGAEEGKTEHRFEKQMAQIIQSIQKTYKPRRPINISGEISLGQRTTEVKISAEQFSDSLGQQILEFFGVETTKKLDSIMGTGLALRKGPVKIDVAGGSYYKINFKPIYDKNLLIKKGNFNRFAKLMLSASFSLKNYSVFKKQLPLEEVQLLRALFDFLPQIDKKLNDDKALSSFIRAIYNRLTLDRVNSWPNTPNKQGIEKAFGEIDFIYRLTGRGQTYDTDSAQLNNFLKQGARYLIYNEHNGSNIYVHSTKYLIYKRMEQRKNEGFALGHGMRIGKGLLKS